MCIPASERPWPCWQTRRGGTTVISIVAAAAFAVAAHAATLCTDNQHRLEQSLQIDRFLEKRRTHLDYDATTATSHLRRGTSEEAEAPRHLTHHLLPHPSAFGASAHD